MDYYTQIANKGLNVIPLCITMLKNMFLKQFQLFLLKKVKLCYYLKLTISQITLGAQNVSKIHNSQNSQKRIILKMSQNLIKRVTHYYYYLYQTINMVITLTKIQL